ncbi:MAG TPA: OsmC family protein [Gemmatimonadaceae bacterium]|nr:OsmC family protein [Gemmatimonadaceae bacterium]
MTAPAGPVNTIRASWRGDHRFESGRPDGPRALLDGDGAAAQAPPDMVLSALAVCNAIDVVDILAKRRTPVATLDVDVVGHRRAEHPRRFMAIELTYLITGDGIERAQAERAATLAFEKYCTVAASLAPDMDVHSVVVVNGERGERVPLRTHA